MKSVTHTTVTPCVISFTPMEIDGLRTTPSFDDRLSRFRSRNRLTILENERTRGAGPKRVERIRAVVKHERTPVPFFEAVLLRTESIGDAIGYGFHITSKNGQQADERRVLNTRIGNSVRD